MYVSRDDVHSMEYISSRVDGMLANFKPGDTLLLQMPILYTPLINYKVLIDRIHQIFHGKVIVLFHDYYGLLRNPTESAETENINLNQPFNDDLYDWMAWQADAIIVHSQAFKKILLKRLKNYDRPIIVQGPWGYLIDKDIEIPKKTFEKKVIFAGDFYNSQFLREDKYPWMPKDWTLEVYGRDIFNNMHTRTDINYHGSFKAHQLPSHFPGGGVGLAWQSDTYPEVEGIASMYTHFNYSHKISLYLTSKVPIILWKQAAPAKWIVDNGLGWAVESLDEAKEILEQLTPKKYDEFQENLEYMSNLVREGLFVKQAVMEAYQAVNQKDYTSKF